MDPIIWLSGLDCPSSADHANLRTCPKRSPTGQNGCTPSDDVILSCLTGRFGHRSRNLAWGGGGSRGGSRIGGKGGGYMYRGNIYARGKNYYAHFFTLPLFTFTNM